MAAITAVVDALLADVKHANFISSAQVYGGTFQQFAVRQKEKGHEVRWVDPAADRALWLSHLDQHTRFIYIEIPSNPSLALCDIQMLTALAQEYDIPLIVDATIATPVLLRPMLYGADIVIHSLSKIMSASGMVIAGAAIAKENIRGHF